MLKELKIKYESESLKKFYYPANQFTGYDILTVTVKDENINIVDSENFSIQNIKDEINTWGILNVFKMLDYQKFEPGIYQLLCEYSFSEDSPIRFTVLASERLDIFTNLLKAKNIYLSNTEAEEIALPCY